jgi:hypothetical protein
VKTLQIDPQTGDLVMGPLKRHEYLTGTSAQVQAIRFFLGTGQGEWFLNSFFGIPWATIFGTKMSNQEVQQEIALALSRDSRVARVEQVLVTRDYLTRKADIQVRAVLTTGDVVEVVPAERGVNMANLLGTVDLRGKKDDGTFEFLTIQTGGQVNVLGWGQTSAGILIPVRVDNAGRQVTRSSEPAVHKTLNATVNNGAKALIWQPGAGKVFNIITVLISVDVAGEWELAEYQSDGATKVRTLWPLYIEGGEPFTFRPGGLPGEAVDNRIYITNSTGANGKAYVSMSGIEE